jgi:hypothetical protein
MAEIKTFMAGAKLNHRVRHTNQKAKKWDYAVHNLSR